MKSFTDFDDGSWRGRKKCVEKNITHTTRCAGHLLTHLIVPGDDISRAV